MFCIKKSHTYIISAPFPKNPLKGLIIIYYLKYFLAYTWRHMKGPYTESDCLSRALMHAQAGSSSPDSWAYKTETLLLNHSPSPGMQGRTLSWGGSCCWSKYQIRPELAHSRMGMERKNWFVSVNGLWPNYKLYWEVCLWIKMVHG